MKTLVVLRHAKSDWTGGGADHDRPLSDRGFNDAMEAGVVLRKTVGRPDVVLCSTANRAKLTWDLAKLAYFPAMPEATEDARIYDAPVLRLLQVLHEVPADADTVVLVGHNPGCEDLSSLLIGSGDPEALVRMEEKYPTSGMAVLDFPESSGLIAGSAVLRSFLVPRG